MNILATAPNRSYMQVASGTFTQANSRLSLVDGTAFFDCGVDLSAYAGLDTGSHEYLIKVYDNDGYVGVASGYSGNAAISVYCAKVTDGGFEWFMIPLSDLWIAG